MYYSFNTNLCTFKTLHCCSTYKNTSNMAAFTAVDRMTSLSPMYIFYRWSLVKWVTKITISKSKTNHKPKCRWLVVCRPVGVSTRWPFTLQYVVHDVFVTSHTRTVVRECFIGDEASQWKRPKFDPSPHQNPLTDLHQNWQAWFRPGQNPACKIL